eukprot:1921080-Alexandrium_andersonii.AAC.1
MWKAAPGATVTFTTGGEGANPPAMAGEDAQCMEARWGGGAHGRWSGEARLRLRRAIRRDARQMPGRRVAHSRMAGTLCLSGPRA